MQKEYHTFAAGKSSSPYLIAACSFVICNKNTRAFTISDSLILSRE